MCLGTRRQSLRRRRARRRRTLTGQRVCILALIVVQIPRVFHHFKITERDALRIVYVCTVYVLLGTVQIPQTHTSVWVVLKIQFGPEPHWYPMFVYSLKKTTCHKLTLRHSRFVRVMFIVWRDRQRRRRQVRFLRNT